ncbi:protein phosphatase 2C domain-containing protein [Acinetobacter sp. 194]|uniref:PP2C family serine/threonine-protein phosphatase n=1 Tax=Acinetobacter shaoyimingii TaxID=2715164 RepID=UPI00140BAB4D|nr:PP2C family serine/threonine-protein phosphatase [Acinetobacter shaoyimingii]NHB58533.1 protein phosphatase 2C domain-containing protein [Acinetobacter shaoyimingii]
MGELRSKIKALLEKNELALDKEFIDYLSLDENLDQLSRLIYKLEFENAKIIPVLDAPFLNDKAVNETDLSSDIQKNITLEATQSIENQAIEIQENNYLETHTLSEPQKIDEIIDECDLQSNNLLDLQEIETPAQLQTNDLNSETNHLTPVQNDIDDRTELLEESTQQFENKSTNDLIESDDQSNLKQNHNAYTQATDPMFLNDIKFQVDNARVGQPYSSKIMVKSKHDASLIKFKPESFKFSRDYFYYDEGSQTIKGQPDIAEEMTFSFQYSFQNETRTTQCKMNVIPDPRSLWKIIEPEVGQLFEKPHLDHAKIVLDQYKIIAASRRGRSHEHGGTFRDDDFGIMQIKNTPWSVIAVADGAGSAEYSREGSRIAIEIVKNEFARYLQGATISSLNEDVQAWKIGSQDEQTQAIATKLNQQFYHVYYEIYKSIITQIENQAADLDVAPKLFSTTLLVAVVYSDQEKTFMSTFSVGDGAIAVYNDTNVRIMNVSDGGEYAGQTKFLDRSIAQEFGSRVKIGCFREIDAIMVMTDGISDPIFETDVGLSNHGKWKKLYQELNPLMQTEDADNALLEWMHFFVPGHHDDRTMAILWKSKD